MKVIYSANHSRHAPPFQFIGGGLKPYPEVPARAEAILRAIEGSYEVMPPRGFSMDAIRAVHDKGYLRFLERAHAAWVDRGGGGETGLIPDTFAARASVPQAARPCATGGLLRLRNTDADSGTHLCDGARGHVLRADRRCVTAGGRDRRLFAQPSARAITPRPTCTAAIAT